MAKKRIRQSPKLPPEERRAQLLKSAGELFLRQGYRSTTTEEIAQHAGVTKGALYFHFKTKEDLLVALVKEMTTSWLEPLERELPKDCSPADVLRLIDEHNRQWVRAGWHFFDFWTQALAIPRIKRHLNRCHHRAVELFVERVSAKYGRTKQQRRELAVFSLALLDGLKVRRILDSQAVNMKRQLELVDLLCDRKEVRGGQHE
ncbi:MAG: TetR/AcrR family transcriptional regulator [Candidatus Zixiibacteriota bacterium]|nr:MAG: TetR/AcrR family transcriptional regulator [candidate division Zixibacteria bacterium]